MTELELAMLRRLRRNMELSPSSPEPTSFQRKAGLVRYHTTEVFGLDRLREPKTAEYLQTASQIRTRATELYMDDRN